MQKHEWFLRIIVSLQRTSRRARTRTRTYINKQERVQFESARVSFYKFRPFSAEPSAELRRYASDWHTTNS